MRYGQAWNRPTSLYIWSGVPPGIAIHDYVRRDLLPVASDTSTQTDLVRLCRALTTVRYASQAS
jgi:hypothetical protein